MATPGCGSSWRMPALCSCRVRVSTPASTPSFTPANTRPGTCAGASAAGRRRTVAQIKIKRPELLKRTRTHLRLVGSLGVELQAYRPGGLYARRTRREHEHEVGQDSRGS